jgi:hypothetical protein
VGKAGIHSSTSRMLKKAVVEYLIVAPAKAGAQGRPLRALATLGSRFRGNDEIVGVDSGLSLPPRKAGSRATAPTAALWLPAYAGMTDFRSVGHFSATC